jgi:uncharacterized heparinase superfamily protein
MDLYMSSRPVNYGRTELHINGTASHLPGSHPSRTAGQFGWQRVLLYFRTARYLQPKQILYYFIRRFINTPSLLRPPANILTRPIVMLEPVGLFKPVKLPSMFLFLNEYRDKGGEHFDWVCAEMPKLWRYNLHYFDYLLDESRPLKYRLYLIHDWIRQNPPGTEDAWEPYTVSLRIVNWIKFCIKHPQSKQAAHEILASLYEQTLWLEKNIEYHILANHYLKNGIALFFAGYFFQGNDAQRWLLKGLRIIEPQLEEQFLADGGHYERSPMYHSIAVLDLLDIMNLALCNHSQDTAFIDLLRFKVTQALDFLCGICLPDGAIPLFNDAALNVAPELNAILSYAQRVFGYTRTDFPEGFGVLQYPQSGYYVARKNNDCLIIDCGEIGPSYQPGHAHCDTLSYELVVDGARVVVDAGVYDYAHGWHRDYCRSTRAHNTVMVDDLEQSEIWSLFRVGRRAGPLRAVMQVCGDSCTFTGAHNGYTRLSGNIIHSRTVQFNSAGNLSVSDIINGSGSHTATSFIHIHPDYKLVREGREILVMTSRGRTIIMKVLADDTAGIDIVPAWYFPEFGKELPNNCIALSASGKLPLHIDYRIQTR